MRHVFQLTLLWEYILHPIHQKFTCGNQREWFRGWGSGRRNSGSSGAGGSRTWRGPPVRRFRGEQITSGGKSTDNNFIHDIVKELVCDVILWTEM